MRPTILTDVRTIVPGVNCARRNDVLIALYTEPVRITQVCCLAADARPLTLRVIREILTGPAIAVDLARKFVVLSLSQSKEVPEEKMVTSLRHHLRPEVSMSNQF